MGSHSVYCLTADAVHVAFRHGFMRALHIIRQVISPRGLAIVLVAGPITLLNLYSINVAGGSMIPALLPGDRILVNRNMLVHGRAHPLKRYAGKVKDGNIILFGTPELCGTGY